jgi:hypothetical protein
VTSPAPRGVIERGLQNCSSIDVSLAGEASKLAESLRSDPPAILKRRRACGLSITRGSSGSRVSGNNEIGTAAGHSDAFGNLMTSLHSEHQDMPDQTILVRPQQDPSSGNRYDQDAMLRLKFMEVVSQLLNRAWLDAGRE